MNNLPRELGRKKTLERLLLDISNGTVIVEGKHDTATLKKLGINSITYSQTLKNPDIPMERKVFILTDNDRRGKEKGERIRDFLVEHGYNVDYLTGTRILKLLNSSSVEQIYAPMIQRLDIKKW